ncbi:hypothetical protein DAPPUDRAFT_266466 [Daphnia pulex]|uniref:Uncharacterized protein n=1 Tax=Daphnia pulex TaxID=6669 RepID=E9HV22_DAPPU|nr:hypothetical protein DAPPUDRAFT_266466 [Daphnia pulex]|eukprot:EFX64411.1 hypothetical protein DAPPUDRAFT_266466 [Daphnia pulex]
MDMKDHDGLTPLMAAVMKSNLKIIHYFFLWVRAQRSAYKPHLHYTCRGFASLLNKAVGKLASTAGPANMQANTSPHQGPDAESMGVEFRFLHLDMQALISATWLVGRPTVFFPAKATELRGKRDSLRLQTVIKPIFPSTTCTKEATRTTQYRQMKLKQLAVARRLVSRERPFNKCKMATKATVTLTVKNSRVTTYFSTNVAITLIRQSAAEALKCALNPVSGPDTSFIDPTTARVFPIVWETSLTIQIKNQATPTVAYVVQDEEIGAAIIMGMDSIIALLGTIIIDGDEQTNPLYPVPGDEKELYPKPVLATGLTVSLASPTYASKCDTLIVPYEGPDRYFDCYQPLPSSLLTFVLRRLCNAPAAAPPPSRWPPPRTPRYGVTPTSSHDVMTGITPDVTPDTTRTQQLPSQHSSLPSWPSLTLGPAGVTTQLNLPSTLSVDELVKCVEEINCRFITSNDVRMECGKSKDSPKNGMDATGTIELYLRPTHRPAVSLTTADLQLQAGVNGAAFAASITGGFTTAIAGLQATESVCKQLTKE